MTHTSSDQDTVIGTKYVCEPNTSVLVAAQGSKYIGVESPIPFCA